MQKELIRDIRSNAYNFVIYEGGQFSAEEVGNIFIEWLNKRRCRKDNVGGEYDDRLFALNFKYSDVRKKLMPGRYGVVMRQYGDTVLEVLAKNPKNVNVGDGKLNKIIYRSKLRSWSKNESIQFKKYVENLKEKKGR